MAAVGQPGVGDRAAQVCATPPSSEHQAWAVPSLTVNVAETVELADVLGGVAVRVTTGAVLSMVKLTCEVALTLPAGSTAYRLIVCAPAGSEL